MVDVQQELEKNTAATLTDEDIERARLLVGVDVASKQIEHITTASYDSIRNFTWGVGDDKPAVHHGGLRCREPGGARRSHRIAWARSSGRPCSATRCPPT